MCIFVRKKLAQVGSLADEMRQGVIVIAGSLTMNGKKIKAQEHRFSLTILQLFLLTFDSLEVQQCSRDSISQSPRMPRGKTAIYKN